MNTNILTEDQKKISQDIYSSIQSASTVLLHCHPNPDPDSVGSALAMKYALEQVGTVIRGDSKIPDAFSHFSGVSDIVQKNFSEINPAEFDLFIVQDSGSTEMISRINPPVFPLTEYPNFKVVVIDHHASNTKYGAINLVATQYQSTTEILFDLFSEWNIKIIPEMAEALYVGLFTDSGGFRYERVTDHTFHMASVLSSVNPQITKSIKTMENSAEEGYIDFLGCALTQKKSFDTPRGSFVISYVTYADVKRLGLTSDNWSGNEVCNMLKSVKKWNVASLVIEETPGVCKVSLRTRDADMYNVSKVAVHLGGGGHPSAAGVVIRDSAEHAVEILAQGITEVLFS
jgi:phosphoesterase RecJ-like protein